MSVKLNCHSLNSLLIFRFGLQIAALIFAGVSGCKPTSLPPPTQQARVAASFSTVLVSTAQAGSVLLPFNGDAVSFQPDSGLQAATAIRGKMAGLQELPSRLTVKLQARPGRISIRSIIATSTNQLIVYVSGTDGQRSLVGLWAYEPQTGALSQIAGADALGDASGFGKTIDLADAQFVTTARGVWLCMHQNDAAAFFLLPSQSAPVLNFKPHRAFSGLKEDNQPFKFLMDDRLYARADGGLGLLRADGRLFSISDDGVVAELQRTAGRPAESVPPLTLGQGDAATQVEFFPDAPPPADSLTAPPMVTDDSVRYPALVIKGPHGTTVIDRDAISVRAGFPVHALRITAWCAEPATGDILAYDAMSGEVMRLKLDLGGGAG